MEVTANGKSISLQGNLIINRFFHFMISSSFAQPRNFHSITNDILLRISTYETDSLTKMFLKKYVPFITEKPKENVDWTAFPPVIDSSPVYSVGHSLTFKKHPYIEIGAKECKLDILTNEQSNTFTGYKTYYITFYFDNKQSAVKAFKYLCKEYDKVSITKKLIKRKRKQFAFYKNNSDLFEQAEFILTEDDIFEDRYKIIFGQIIDPYLADI